MRGEASGVAVVVVAAALAGCLGNASVEPAAIPPDSIEALLQSVPLVVDHDHHDIAAHRGSHNMAQVAYDGLNAGGETWVFGEADVVGDYAYVATLMPRGGFFVVDIADPAAPAIVGRYDAATTYAADLKVTDDGRYAILGSQALANQQHWMPPAGTPPLDGSSVGVNGFQVISLADPASPRFDSFLPVTPAGVHMLDLHVIDGATYAFGAPGGSGHVTIARLVDTPAGGVLVPLSEYLFGPDDRLDEAGLGAAFPGGPHDVTIYDDDESGRAYMLVAAGVEGVHVVDVSDPALPMFLGAWKEHDGRYVHTVMPAIIEGKRLIVATPETFTADEQQPLWVIDASDPGAMATLGTWRLPGEDRPYDGAYLFSTHNMNVRDGVVYLAHFHAGLWVLDIRTLAKAAAPEVLGAFVPAEAGNDGSAMFLEAAPLVWDVVPLENGRVLILDIPTGLYVVSDPAAPAMDAAAEPAPARPIPPAR